MKKLLFSIGMFLAFTLHAQESRVDTVAVMIIDRMASVIGELNSCSFTLNTSTDITDPDFGLVKQIETSEVYISGPDKMHINFSGDKGHRGFYYNGALAVVYWYDENNYAIIDAPDNTMAMVDSVNKHYGIEFPAADFFYPTITDDMLTYFDDLVFLGKRILDGKSCWLILASNKEMSAQIWFSGDAFTLPQKFVIIYKNDGNRQYEAEFTNWQLNPDIPAPVFDFLPPPGARMVKILPKSK